MFLNYRDSYLAISWQKYATIDYTEQSFNSCEIDVCFRSVLRELERSHWSHSTGQFVLHEFFKNMQYLRVFPVYMCFRAHISYSMQPGALKSIQLTLANTQVRVEILSY